MADITHTLHIDTQRDTARESNTRSLTARHIDRQRESDEIFGEGTSRMMHRLAPGRPGKSVPACSGPARQWHPVSVSRLLSVAPRRSPLLSDAGSGVHPLLPLLTLAGATFQMPVPAAAPAPAPAASFPALWSSAASSQCTQRPPTSPGGLTLPHPPSPSLTPSPFLPSGLSLALRGRSPPSRAECGAKWFAQRVERFRAARQGSPPPARPRSQRCSCRLAAAAALRRLLATRARHGVRALGQVRRLAGRTVSPVGAAPAVQAR